MSRLRLDYCIPLGLVATGMGLNLVSNADEGIRLYYVFRLISLIRISDAPETEITPSLRPRLLP